jgi:chemotaxis protein MotB
MEMKKSLQTLVFLTLVIGLVFTSCGPGKKLTASRAKVDKLQKDSTSIHNQLNACSSEVKKLNQDKATLENENASVTKDLKALSTESKMTIADQANQLKNFQAMVRAQKDIMNKLKLSIANALMNYKSDELYVSIVDGNVYVSLSEKLLFKSGSDVVDPKGKEALKTLAKVLSSTKDISVMIEGHTDNVPIKTKLFKDNWDLSTARATSIVRILSSEDGFDANRIIASGRSEFHPIKTNETEVGRADNRRTEIILSPDLKELYALLK